MKLHQILLLSSYMLCVKSQVPITGKSQIGNNQQTSKQNVNQHQIYFPHQKSPETTNVDVQRSVEPIEPQTIQQDSYSQAALGLQNVASYSTESLNPNINSANTVPLPSLGILPPKKTEQNYYTAYNDKNEDVVTRTGEADDLPWASHRTLNFNNVSFAVSNFGLNLLKNVDNRRSNLVISPFSIAELLALLQQGALGQTQQQISEALQMAPQTSVESFRKANERFEKRSSRNILRVANNVFVADAFDLNPAFKSIAIRAFGSEVTPLRFSRAQDAVQKINGWVAQKTNNKITDLLAEDAVNENTQVLMVNAVYFKGLWAIKFKPESTLPRDFYLNDISKKPVPFMRIRKIFRAGTDPSNHAQFIILPFENEQYSLMVIVPSVVSSLDALVASLTPMQLASYFTATPKEVDLEIPKFVARADTDLNEAFRKMGITNVFGQKSELSGLGTYRTHSPQLSSALHSAMLAIDEEGGSAAAATSFAVVALSYDDPSVIIKANRPFLTILWDSESVLPLFMARIEDPSS